MVGLMRAMPWYDETAVVLIGIAITAFFLVQAASVPASRETAITAGTVVAMVGIASVFFLVADQVMRVVVTFLLGNA
jgi:hypothetical protein